MLLLVLIAGGAVYEAGVALAWISIGRLPGEGAPGEGAIVAVAVVALLAGMVFSLFASSGQRLVAGLAPAGAMLMVARFYSFGSYYAPSLRRASEGGVVGAGWVYILVALAVLAGVITLLRPRLAFVGAPVMFLCAVTTFFADTGH